MHAGMPTAVAPGGISFKTTAFEPTRAPSPTVNPPSTLRRHSQLRLCQAWGDASRPYKERCHPSNTLIDGAVVTNLGGFADHNPKAMI